VSLSADAVTLNADSSISATCTNGSTFYADSSGYTGFTTYGLILKHPNGPADSRLRLAMAPTPEDKLFLNCNGNYTGGVCVDGPMSFNGPTTVTEQIVTSKLTIGYGSTLVAVISPAQPPTKQGPVTIYHPEVTMDLVQALTYLRQEVETLQNRVQNLESKVH